MENIDKRSLFSNVTLRVKVFALLLLINGALTVPPAFAHLGNWGSNPCTNCHSVEAGGTFYVMVDGNDESDLTVSAAPGQTLEIDYYYTGVRGASDTTVGIMWQVPTLPSAWTVQPGTANTKNTDPGPGWAPSWDNLGSHAASTTAGYYIIDYSAAGAYIGGNGTASDDGSETDAVGDRHGGDFRVTVPVGASGGYSIVLYGVGHNGNGRRSKSVTLTVNVSGGDSVKPTVDSFTAAAVVNSNVNIPVTSFTASDDTGVTGFMITESATPPAAGAAGWTGIAPTTYTSAAGDGTKTLYPWAKDAAGNVSLVYGPANVLVDATAPTTTHNAPAGWQAADVNVTLTPNDGTGSGINTTEYCIDGINACTPGTVGTSVNVTQTAGTAGTQYVRFRSTDNVGNVEATKSATVQIDKSVPSDGVLTVTPGNTQNSLSWTSASDTGSDLSPSSAYNVRFLTGATPPTCASGTSIYTGTALSYPHTGLANGTQYSYRVCAADAVGNVSPGATGTGTPSAVNTPPADPPQVSFVQYQNDGSTVVGAGAFTKSISPVIKGTVTDPDGDTVQLEVEIQLIASPFTNTPNCTSGSLVASGSTAQVTCGPLADGRYKWQARGKDSLGATSGWVQY